MTALAKAPHRILIPALKLALWHALIGLFLVQTAAGAPPHGQAGNPAFQSRPVGSIEIQFDDFNEHESIARWRETVLSVLHFREGSTLTSGLLEDSRQALLQLDQFSKIDLSVTEEQGLLAVVYRLKPYRFIRDIVIRGNYPVFEKDILNIMTIEAGDTFKPDMLPAQEELIRKHYAGQGYPDAAVSLRADRASDGNYIVRVSIEKQKALKYCGVLITGNKAISDIAVKLKLMTESERFIESEFKKKIAELASYYREKKYPESEITYRAEIDVRENCVDLLVLIAEGPRYRVEFNGNQHFWNATLMKQVTLFKTGNRNNAGLRKSTRNLVAFYRARGYLNARVKAEIRKEGSGNSEEKIIVFNIDEGPRTEISSVAVTGNTFFNYRMIRSIISTKKTEPCRREIFNPDRLNNDLRIIESRYRREGFADATAAGAVQLKQNGALADIVITVTEGTRTFVSSIVFAGQRSVTELQLRNAIGIAPGKPYQEAGVDDAENIISAMIAETGHPHVAVRSRSEMSDDRSKVKISFTIDEGKQVTIGSLNFVGNLRTASSYLAKQAGLRPGEIFSPRKLTETSGNIGDIAALQSYRLKTFGLAEKNDRLDIVFDIREKKAIHLGLGGGYKSDRGLFADASVEDGNFLGRYKSVWLKGGASQTGYHGSAGFAEPRLIGSRASASVSFNAEKKKEFNKDFGTLNYGPQATMTIHWLDRLTTSLGANYNNRKIIGSMSLSDLGNIDLADQYYLRKVLDVSVLIGYDGRDSVVRPRNGFMAAGSADVSFDLSGKRNTLFTEYTDNFIRYSLDLKFFFSPFSRLTFAAQAKIGYIQTYTSRKQVFNDTLWYLGGIATVRGFEENMLQYDYFKKSLGGRASVLANLEARIDLGFNFELSAFLDAGRIDNTFYGFWKVRASAGVGLSYITPVGPIGLQYGIKIDRRKGEDIGMLHFSVGYSF